jgi:hypothetical protein
LEGLYEAHASIHRIAFIVLAIPMIAMTSATGDSR